MKTAHTTMLSYLSDFDVKYASLFEKFVNNYNLAVIFLIQSDAAEMY